MKLVGLGLALALLVSSQVCHAEEVTDGTRTNSPNIEVKLPEHIFYNGVDKTTLSLLFGGGAIGGLLAESTDPTSDKIKAYLRNEQIDIAEIVKTEFEFALKSRPELLRKFQESGQGQFTVEVYNYGLARIGAFSGEFKTLIGIKAKLIDGKEKIFWEGKGFTRTSDDQLKPNTFKAYFEDREPFVEGFKKSSEIAIRRMFNNSN